MTSPVGLPEVLYRWRHVLAALVLLGAACFAPQMDLTKIYNPGEASAFARIIGTLSLRDNVSLEGSAALFAGSGADVLARLADRDFLYARLKVFF